MNNPLVSIIVPTKNSSQFLEACLESIKNQTYKNLELIVVDNSSTDNTQQIARRFTDKVFTKGPERSAQVNFGVEQASGKYVYKVDSDFVLDPLVVQQCIDEIAKGYDAIVVHNSPDVRVSWIARIRKFEVDMYKYDITHSSARFVRKDVYQAIRGFNENITAGEDYDFQNKLNRAGYKTGFIDAEALHLGEPTNFWKHMVKYYEYGRDFVNYQYENENESEQQLGLIRVAYLKHWKLFLQHPILSVEFIVYSLFKFGSGGLGFLNARIDRLHKPITPDSLIVGISSEQEAFPSISFILPTLNASEYLDKCLSSIYKQEYPKDKIEVLLIDGGSSDETLAIASKYPVKVLKNERRVAEYGKTIGILQSRGKYFILIDADNEIVEKDWLQKMIFPIVEHPELFGVESRLSYDKTLSSLNRFFARIRIADPLARCLASKPEKTVKSDNYEIPYFSKDAVLITGANGFLWNKDLVMRYKEFWQEKFEEANFSTYIHEKTDATYAIPINANVRHFYCDSLSDFIAKRKKIATKMTQRLRNKEYAWVEKKSRVEIGLYSLYLGTFIGPLAASVYKNIKERTWDYFWYPFASLITITVYVVLNR